MDATADVGAVKAKVRESQGYGGEENVVLVHKGKVLTDDATLESVGVTEESFVVVMVQKPKAAPKPKPAPAATTPAPTPTPATAEARGGAMAGSAMDEDAAGVDHTPAMRVS